MTVTPQSIISRNRELGFFVLVLTLINLPLLSGHVWETLLFVPSRVAAGDWWRVLTSPFAHVGLYHLALDAGAFLLLYRSLQEPSRAQRLAVVAACAVGSLLAALPQLLPDRSLCGLSGIDHGLLAYAALELTTDREKPLVRAGLASLLIVLAKAAYEAVAGHVLFAGWHLGDVASPVAVCHAGGVLGGLAAYGWMRLKRKRPEVRGLCVPGEGQASACPDEQTLIPPCFRARHASDSHSQPTAVETISTSSAKSVFVNNEVML